jgi:nucleoside-diphosphate-sugar epimerase
MQKAYNTGEIPYKTGQDGRQYIHVSDAVSGYIMAIERGVANDTPTTPTFHFSIDTYPGTTDHLFIRVHELADLVSELTKRPAKHDNRDKISQENPMLALNCDETKQILGWQPQKEFKDSLDELAQRWYHPRITDQMRKGFIKGAIVDAARLLQT